MPSPSVRLHNRELVLDAAFKSFCEHGIAKTTLKHLQEFSGVSVRSIQRYFPTKLAIIEELLPFLLHPQYVKLRALVATPEFQQLSGREQILTVLRNRVDFCREHHSSIVCFTEMEVYAAKHGRGADLWRRCTEDFQEMYDIFDRAFAKGIADGSISSGVQRDDLRDVLGLGFMGMMMRIALLRDNAHFDSSLAERHVNAALRLAEAMLQVDMSPYYADKKA